jgi:hypothetical protein
MSEKIQSSTIILEEFVPVMLSWESSVEKWTLHSTIEDLWLLSKLIEINTYKCANQLTISGGTTLTEWT